jgi:signal transduction histidine kinase
MKAAVTYFIFLILPTLAVAQNTAPDKLKDLLRAAQTDSARHELAGKLVDYYAEGNRELCLKYAEICINLDQKDGKTIDLADDLNAKGYQFTHQRKFTEALTCFSQAKTLAEDPSNENKYWRSVRYRPHVDARLEVLASIYHDMGHLMGATGDQEQQIAYYRLAIATDRQGGSGAIIPFANMNLGSVYLRLGKLDSALILSSKAAALFEKSADKVYLGRVYLNIGLIYDQKKDRPHALWYFRKAEITNRTQNNLTSLAETYLSLSNYYSDLKSPDSSLFYAKKMMAVARSISIADFSKAYEALVATYKLNHRPDSVSKYLSLALTARDSVYDATLRSLSAFQKLSFKTQSRLNQLEKEKELARSRNRTYILSSIVAFLAVLALIFYRNNRQKQKANHLLTEQKEEISAQRDELENTNRELAIEASLERVRTVAMSMTKADDLLSICEILFTELEKLGFNEIRNSQIFIYNDHKGSFINYGFSVYEGAAIAEIYYDSHPKVNAFVTAVRKTNDAFAELKISGDELKAWRNYRIENGEQDDPRLANIDTLYYYFYSIGVGAIGISNFESISAWQLQVLKRFRNVFDLAYRRYVDIANAAAQTREAQIEAALERVRSSAMSMHQSKDIDAAVLTVFEELEKLDLDILRCGIGIIDKEDKVGNIWTTAKIGGKSSIQISGKEPMWIHPLLQGTFDAWLKQTDFLYELEGDDLVAYYKAVAGTNFTLPKSHSLTSKQSAKQYYYTPTFKTGNLYAFKDGAVPEAAKNIMKRFASVLNLTFSRFLDLQKAEAQAREAQIETALEKVRSRTLAMQRSDELAETAAVLFRQMIGLGIEPNRLYIAILKEDDTEMEFWITGEDGSRISDRFSGDAGQNRSMKKMSDAWKAHEKSMVIDMQGDELHDYFAYLGELHMPFKGGLEQKRRIQYISFFSSGLIGMASPDEQPQAAIDLLDRFAYVLNLTFARFNDLKTAEQHAIQAEQDLVAIKAARQNAEEALIELRTAQTKLIQSEKMASLGELTAGIAHEIQNPLNFVNNFSEVSVELLDELKEEAAAGNIEEVIAIAGDLTQNLEKISHHGKRADSIVKGMLEHSRAGSGERAPANINALADEFLKLSYHGLRAREKSFNAELVELFDPDLPPASVVQQDIGRVLVNLFNNAFYAVRQKQKTAGAGYKPTVTVATSSQNGEVIVKIKDNGAGIPENIKDKIMQPFFTTKPTGEGTGLGLSLSYDIVVKGHGGTINLYSKEQEYTEFTITLPL